MLHLLFPLAPPRMLPAAGLVDTGQVYGPTVYGATPATDTMANQFAAMPSLHVGWAVMVAVGLIVATGSRWRWLWLLHPAITLLVVVGTANHYWLDAIVVVALLAVAFAALRLPRAARNVPAHVPWPVGDGAVPGGGAHVPAYAVRRADAAVDPYAVPGADTAMDPYVVGASHPVRPPQVPEPAGERHADRRRALLVSAGAYAAAAVAQSRLAGRTDPSTGILRLLGRGAWWSAVGLNAGGALLHVAALNYGPLTLVQPLGALTLVAAVPLGARAAGRRVGRTEWRGTALTLLGLGALLLTAGGSAPHETLTLPEALGVGAATMAVVAGLSRPGARPGLRHAAASGITSGVASALTQTLTVAVTDHSGGPLFSWRLLTVALLVSAFAMGGLLLSQTAYRGGLGAPLAVVTLANPVAAAAIGLALLGERLQGGPVSLVLALLGTAAAVRGVILLSRAQARATDPGEVAAPPVPVVDPVPSRVVIGSPRRTDGTPLGAEPLAAVRAGGPSHP